MNQLQTIQCPNEGCHGTIQFDPYLLVQGKSFRCGVCNSAISLNEESKQQVQIALNEFDKLKNEHGIT